MDMEVPRQEEDEEKEVQMLITMSSVSCCRKYAPEGYREISKSQSWDSIVHNYMKSGALHQILDMYRKMDLTHLSGRTVVSLLQVCAKLKDLQTGLEIHEHVAETGLFQRDLCLGSALMDMYIKCGCLNRAKQIFDKLPVRNVFSWTILITGYTEHGYNENALECFETMKLEGVSPNAQTFVSSLKACCRIGAKDKGEEMHSEIRQQGILDNIFVGSALVDMYVKWGLIEKAQEVFFDLPNRNVVIWTALLAGYTQYGFAQKALWCFQQMQLEGVTPNAVTYACTLKACSSLNIIERGILIHAMIQKQLLSGQELFIGSSLVDMYAKCGLIAVAKRVFGDFTYHNVVLWNSLVTGLIEHGYGEEALECCRRMQLDGISPDVITLICNLKACGIVRAVDKGREIHAVFVTLGLIDSDLAAGNTLIDMYSKCGSLTAAENVFRSLPAPNTVSWNSLIAGYIENGNGEKALNLFEEMRRHDVVPDAVTYLCILKACGSVEAADKADKILAEVRECGLLENNVFIGSTLVDLYSKCGSISKGQHIFNNFRVRDVVIWNALITAYAESGHGEEALKCFGKMQTEGFYPNAVTLISCLKACGGIGATKTGQEIHAEIEKRGLLERENVGNALVHMYALCGLLQVAECVFDSLPLQDVVSWTVLMMGYAQIGQSQNVFGNFNRMVAHGIEPNPITLVVILIACNRSGLLGKCQTYFDVISKDLGIFPTIKHLTCIIDLLSRSGHLEKAMAMMKRLPICSNPVTSHILLGASRTFGNLDIGEQVFKMQCTDDRSI